MSVLRKRQRKPKVPLERNVESRCIHYAKRRRWLVRKMNGLGFRSWCDRLFIPPPGPTGTSLVLWVEFKRIGKGATPAQQAHHEDLRARGQRVYVVRTFDEFKLLLETHMVVHRG